MRPILSFAAATLTPVLLLALAATLGGVWVALALVYMTGLTAVLDEVVARATPEGDDREFPAADGLSVLLALAHFVLLVLVVRALAGEALGGWGKAGLFLAGGLFFGQVSNANAHELIHRSSRLLHRLGMWVYISVGFGHHSSAHPLVHHVRVATEADPNSARLGESYYRFARRAWAGSFAEGWRAERARLARAGRPLWRHPYWVYLGGTAAVAAGMAWAFGPWGLLAWAGLSAHAQAQLLLSDYVQHYGLSRATGPDGRPVPVGDRHSWNSPHPVSSALILNAPRHSDHHAHPARPYPALRLPPAREAPRLPRSLPVMATLALFPRAWAKVMDDRARRWQEAG